MPLGKFLWTGSPLKVPLVQGLVSCPEKRGQANLEFVHDCSTNWATAIPLWVKGKDRASPLRRQINVLKYHSQKKEIHSFPQVVSIDNCVNSSIAILCMVCSLPAHLKGYTDVPRSYRENKTAATQQDGRAQKKQYPGPESSVYLHLKDICGGLREEEWGKLYMCK